MTVAASPELVAAVASKNERTFELINRSKSAWVKKGNEGSTSPQKMNSPKESFLPLESRVWDEKVQRYRKTQYIPNANTIYVDDYQEVDESGALVTVKGLRSQQYDLKWELEVAKKKRICFFFGLLYTDKYGGDSTLLEFLKNHEDNEERPNHLKRDPRKFNLFNFRPLRKEEKAIARTIDIEVEAEALEFVKRVRTKTKDGYAYNNELISVLLKIFDEGAGLKDDEYAQKSEILFRIAKANGAAFMKIIHDTFEEYRMSIAKGVKFNILSITSKEARMTIGTKTRSIVQFGEEKKEEERIEKLCMHFLGSPSGVNDYAEMHQQVEVDAIAAHKRG